MKYFSLKTAALMNWGNLLIHLVLGFVITPIVLSSLGNEGFGIWSVILSITGYYGLANLGLGAALSRYITRDYSERDFRSLQMTVDAATTFFVVTGVVVLALAAAAGQHLAGWLRINSVAPALFGWILLVASAGIVADFFRSISNSLLAACERYTLVSYLTLLQRLSLAAGTIAVLVWRPGLLELAVVNSANTILFQVAAQTLARRGVSKLNFFPRSISLRRLGELLRYGSGSVLITVVNLVRLRLGNILIARYVDVASVTSFTIATNLITNYNSAISGATSAVGVRFTKLDASAPLAELHRTYRQALFSTSLLSFGIGLLMLIFADRFLMIWLGREMPQTVAILQILVPVYMISLCQGPGWNMMFARGRHHPLAWVTLGETALCIALAFALLPNYGAVGFALATALSMALVKLTFQPWFAARVGNLPLKAFLEPMVIPAFAALALIGFAKVISIEPWLRSTTVVWFFASVVAFGASYVVSVLLLCRGKSYVPAFVAKYAGRLPGLTPPKQA